MPAFELATRTFGTEIFHCADGPSGGYVFDEDGNQPCFGGGYRGSTLTATSSTLETVVRRWHRQRMEGRREAGLYPGYEADMDRIRREMDAEAEASMNARIAKALAPYGYSTSIEAQEAGDWDAWLVAEEAAIDPNGDPSL